MVQWHDTRSANLVLRSVGIGALALGWMIERALYHHLHTQPFHQAHLDELGLCAVLVVTVLAGAMLLIVGPLLWRQVAVPGHCSFNLADDAASDQIHGDFANDNAGDLATIAARPDDAFSRRHATDSLRPVHSR